MKSGSIYSASDKALFDALNQKAVNNAEMHQLFLSHGMIVSRHTSRINLAAHYSRLVHDYIDFQALAKLFDSGHRRERLSSFHVNSKAEIGDYETAAHAVVSELKSNADSASVSVNDDGSIKVLVRYKIFNFNKSEFRQLEVRDAVITLEKDGGQVVIRGPQNEKVDEICRSLLSKVKESVEGDFGISEISLEEFTSPSQRTNFFLDLITSVHGYKKYDVTDVYVFNPNKESELTDEEEGEEDDDVEPHLGVHISRALLKGEGVLESSEMKDLFLKGFYISRIIWQTKRSGEIDSDIYEFEAQFSEPETCTKFSYLAKGHYKYQGNQIFSKTKTQLSHDEDIELSKAIEAAARTCLDNLNGAAEGEDK